MKIIYELNFSLFNTGTNDKLQSPNTSDDEEKPAATLLVPDAAAKDPNAPVREWDVGKQIIGKMVEPADKLDNPFFIRKGLLGVSSLSEMTQEEWVDKQRDKREVSFAPPSSYSNNTPGQSMTAPSYDAEDRLQREYNQQSFKDDYSSKEIVNECIGNSKFSKSKHDVGTHDSSTSRGSCSTRRKGVEIAPPVLFEYYTPEAKKQKLRDDQNNDMKRMEEAIMKGIRQMKENS